MGKYFSAFLTRLTVFLEFFISIMLAVGIILLCARLAGSLIHIPDLDVYPNYDDLLAACFELIIGVELIRMMCYHTPRHGVRGASLCHCPADHHRPHIRPLKPESAWRPSPSCSPQGSISSSATTCWRKTYSGAPPGCGSSTRSWAAICLTHPTPTPWNPPSAPRLRPRISRPGRMPASTLRMRDFGSQKCATEKSRELK